MPERRGGGGLLRKPWVAVMAAKVVSLVQTPKSSQQTLASDSQISKGGACYLV